MPKRYWSICTLATGAMRDENERSDGDKPGEKAAIYGRCLHAFRKDHRRNGGASGDGTLRGRDACLQRERGPQRGNVGGEYPWRRNDFRLAFPHPAVRPASAECGLPDWCISSSKPTQCCPRVIAKTTSRVRTAANAFTSSMAAGPTSIHKCSCISINVRLS